jgi:anti-sigma factor RsiW
MMDDHVELELVPYLSGELDAAARTRVAAHLAGCVGCRRLADDAREVLGRLAATLPAPPEIHWGRFRADLARRLEAPAPRSWRARPVPLLAGAALAALLVVIAVRGLGHRGAGGDPLALEDPGIGARLGLFESFRVVERLELLELLENLDVIRDLDRLPQGEG